MEISRLIAGAVVLPAGASDVRVQQVLAYAQHVITHAHSRALILAHTCLITVPNWLISLFIIIIVVIIIVILSLFF